MNFTKTDIDHLRQYFLAKLGGVIQGDIKVDKTDAYDLGTSDKRWRTIYAKQIVADNVSGEGGGSGGNMDVLLVAVKKDKISEYRSAIEQAGRNAAVVDVDVFALQNCYEMNYGIDPGRVVALLNIGASIMNVNVVKGGVSVFNRDIGAGGNQFTDAIQKDLNLSFEQAEALKKGEQVDGASAESLQPILHAVSENIAMEVQKTFDFFRATSQEDRIDQIYLSGGTAKVRGLRELLAEKFGAPVEMLNPFLNVHYSEKDFNPEVLEDLAPSAAIAVGLAGRRVGDR